MISFLTNGDKDIERDVRNYFADHNLESREYREELILGTTILGTMLFKETISLPQAGCIIMIAAGIMGLKLLG